MANDEKKRMEAYAEKQRVLMDELVKVPYALICNGTISRWALSHIGTNSWGSHFIIYNPADRMDSVSDHVIAFRCDRVTCHVIVNHFKEMGYELARGRIERYRGKGSSDRVNDKDHEHRFEIALRKSVGPDFIDDAMSGDAKREVRKFNQIMGMDND